MSQSFYLPIKSRDCSSSEPNIRSNSYSASDFFLGKSDLSADIKNLLFVIIILLILTHSYW
jgi:hypothetical protein